MDSSAMTRTKIQPDQKPYELGGAVDEMDRVQDGPS
jgi:hypothetical protein